MRTRTAATALRRLRPAEYERLREALAAEGLPTEDLHSAANRFYAWEENGQMLGFAGLERHGPTAILRSVVVAAERRRSGIGRRLVEAVIDRAQPLGHREVYLLTTTAPEFFERLGFTRIERNAVPPPVAATAEFTRLCPASAVCMRRRLDRT